MLPVTAERLGDVDELFGSSSTEPLFAACGFQPTDRPSGRRVVMRRELEPDGVSGG
jgi:hypothetical protein